MAEHSHIEWTDATWNPITGCSVISPGCANCYAMKLAGGRLRGHPSRAGLTEPSKAGPVWNGQVRLNQAWLKQPLQWSAPRRIFVCAHGDLFHEAVPDAWIDKVFAVMALAPQHTFQVLTKRPERARDYLSWDAHSMSRITRRLFEEGENGVKAVSGDLYTWPLPNVWLGVSAEDQIRAENRIPALLETPAAVRFVSAEPLLGPIDLSRLHRSREFPCGGDEQWLESSLSGRRFSIWAERDISSPKLDWVIVGGESGAGARPMHPDWARKIRDDCAAAGVPFFFKQWGEWAPFDQWFAADRRRQIAIGVDGTYVPDDVAPQNVGGQRFMAVGKREAGRLLDGRTHDAMPT